MGASCADGRGHLSMNLRPSGIGSSARRSLGADATLTAATNLAIAHGLLHRNIAARLLGPHGRGELAAIQTTPSFFGSFAMIGMPEALVYFSAQKPAQQDVIWGPQSGSPGGSAPFTAAAYLAMPLLLHAQGPVLWQLHDGT